VRVPQVSIETWERTPVTIAATPCLVRHPMTKARTAEKVPDGSLSTHNGFSLISNEKLLEIYSTMLKCRMLEERIHLLDKRKKAAKSSNPSVHVAAIAGAAIDLLSGDTLAPSQGGLTPCFAKGLPLAAIFPIVLSSGALPRPRYSALNLIPPSLSASKQLDRSLAAAAICKAKRNKKAAVVFLSDASGASSELERAMMVAGKKKLPILFVYETKSLEEEQLQRANDLGVPGVAVEDDDAVAVYRVATEALAHARRGSGPTLIECRPWPFNDRGTSKGASAKHPIGKMETYLAGKGLFSRQFKTKLVAQFNRELDAAIKAAAR
jgi:TPP-dependent pyruvate/acetoin dehydrogenase alpha subunit